MAGMMIVLAGKGGSGKTTMSSMLIRELLRRGLGPVLAVDADPNATLALALGTEEGRTVADLRDDMGQAAQSVSEIPKDRLMDQWLSELIVEETGYDMLTMGRPEGPKCYCYVNGLLRRYLEILRKNYPYVVVDCEAGMEYLSRLTVGDVDALVLVTEHTVAGRATARRIATLADSLPMQVKRRVLALNKSTGGNAAADEEGFDDLDGLVHVPFDEDLAQRAATGEAIDEAAGSSAGPVVKKLLDMKFLLIIKQIDRQRLMI